jgi:hypothetical protein
MPQKNSVTSLTSHAAAWLDGANYKNLQHHQTSGVDVRHKVFVGCIVHSTQNVGKDGRIIRRHCRSMNQ